MILHGMYKNGNIEILDKPDSLKKDQFKVLIFPEDDSIDVFEYIQSKRVQRNVPAMDEKEIEDIIHNIRSIK